MYIVFGLQSLFCIALGAEAKPFYSQTIASRIHLIELQKKSGQS